MRNRNPWITIKKDRKEELHGQYENDLEILVFKSFNSTLLEIYCKEEFLKSMENFWEIDENIILRIFDVISVSFQHFLNLFSVLSIQLIALLLYFHI